MWTVGIVLGPDTRMYDVSVAREVFDTRPDPELPATELLLLAERPSTRLDEHTRMQRTHALSSAAECDLLVVPGSNRPATSWDSARAAALRAGYDSGATVAALCTGAFLLAATGLLDGEEATTHWRYADELAATFPAVTVRPNRLYVGHDRLWTSAGVTAGTDLLLHLVRRWWGAAPAATVARSLVTAPCRPGTQAQFMPPAPTRSGPGVVARIQSTVLAEPDRAWSLEQLAAACGVSVRTLTRTFGREVGTPVGSWVIDQRIRVAQTLLETTDLPVERVARAAGFSSADLLRKHFRSRLHVTPGQHRVMFQDGHPIGGAGGP